MAPVAFFKSHRSPPDIQTEAFVVQFIYPNHSNYLAIKKLNFNLPE